MHIFTDVRTHFHIFLLNNVMQTKTERRTREFYLGNPSLPMEDTEYDWTPQMVSDIKKSKKNILHFAENFFHIVNLDSEDGIEKIKLRSYQRRILRALRDNRFNIVLASRQIGKTTLFTIYALWVACFNNYQRILIAANKEETAKEVYERIQIAFEQLPNYLKPGVKGWGKTGLELANGSKISITTTASTAGRGKSCNCLILDELAHIDDSLVRKFWASAFPVISSSKKSKVLIASTPDGTGNLFHELWSGAIDSRSWNGWHAERVDWWDVPGRDDEWKRLTLAQCGSQEVFDQEFGCEFLDVGDNMLSEASIQRIEATLQEPKWEMEDGAYLLWEDPNPERIYVAGVDVSEGIGQAASCIQIFDVTDLTEITQVATYHSRTIGPYEFKTKLVEIMKHWGNPLVAVERNKDGAGIIDDMIRDDGYENIVTYRDKSSTKYDKQGVHAHTNTKHKGVVNMRYWLIDRMVVNIRDRNFLKELKTFVRFPNGTWGHVKDGNSWDDRIMSAIWALILLDNGVCERYFDIKQFDDNNKPLIIELMDYKVKYFMNPSGLEIGDQESAPLPFVYGTNNTHDSRSDDIQELESQGWELVGSPHWLQQ